VHFAIACAHTGVIAVPLDPRSSNAAVRRLIERTEAVAVLTRDEHRAHLGDAGVPVFELRTLVPETLPPIDDALVVLRTRQAEIGSLYVIQPTSGTTGEPKLMLRTQRPFHRIGRVWTFPQVPTTPQRHVMVNPLTHGAGVLNLWCGISQHATLCIPSRPNVDAPLDDVRALDPHVFVIVPRILRSWYRQQVAAGEPVGMRLLGPSARVLAFGGATCDPDLQALLESQGVEVVEMFGTSETGICVMTPPGERRPTWSGLICSDCEIKLADDGELLVKSPVMMEGYLGDDQQTRDAIDPDGFYRTGDYGELDGAGWVRIVGRKKDVFNTPTGNNIFPSRIEDMLELVPEIQQVVLVGDGRPFVTALVTWNAQRGAPDAERLAAQIRAVNARIEDEERIRRFQLLDAPIGADLYRPVGHGKVRRERKLIDERYREIIEAMYREPSPAHAV
jgi:long-chain acyl-CoA synthetase